MNQPSHQGTRSDGESQNPPSAPPESNYGATFADAGTGPTSGTPVARRPVAASETYKVVHLIGRGGMGSVSLAQDVRLHRWVALKRLSGQFASDARLLSRFHTEARSVGSLSHFHIVQVYAMDEDEEGPYIAMEYVAGPVKAERPDWQPGLPNPPMDLEDLVKQQGVLTAVAAARLGIKLCSAVGYAHKRGVIHRDIKPANIMLNEDGEPKLVDFGLARQGNREREGMTLAGAQLLTLGYGAPEQEIDASRVDERADIYALGGTLWFAVTGQNPRFFRESEVPAPLRPILVKALQKDREKRFQTAAEFEQALARLDPNAASLPGQDSAGATERGRCPQCGHQHVLHPKEVRKFCESCGTPLVEPCLKCGAENGVWAKFCGPCGADLVAGLDAALEELQANRERIEANRRQYRFYEALAELKRMATTNHPKLVQYGKWARETLPAVEAEQAEAVRCRDANYQTAETLAAGRDFPVAMAILEKIPPPLQTDRSRELFHRCESLLARRTALADEMHAALASKQYLGLKPKVVELSQLEPDSGQFQKLLSQLDAWEHQYQESVWKAACQHKTVEAYRRYMEAYPAGPHVSEARQGMAAPLRNLLLQQIQDVALRQEYIQVRTPALGAQDDAEALLLARKVCAAAGGVAGLILGFLVGGAGSPWAALIAGAIGGAITAFFIDR